MAPERRHALRQKVNTPAFASFDGVTGGMILDLSEEGMAMQALAPLEANSLVPLHLSLGEPAAYLETTGYVAWADALGRAGVRFSDLPDEARAVSGNGSRSPSRSTTVQYEFKSLNGDMDMSAALNLIASRACSITRGSGAAVALIGENGMTCRASAGTAVPEIGARVDLASGFTGECIRCARPLRCDDAECDAWADAEACRQLGIRSILAAPVLYERDLVGLLEVFSTRPFAFDDGDLAVVERLAQTVVLTLSRAEALQRE